MKEDKMLVAGQSFGKEIDLLFLGNGEINKRNLKYMDSS